MAELTSNFSKINFVPNQTNLEKIDLNTIFNAVITGLSLEVNETLLEYILLQELSIDAEILDDSVRKMLNESIIYYMNVWPGWQRYDEYNQGKLIYTDWLEKFRMYLMFKTNFCIQEIVKLRNPPKRKLTDHTTQTTDKTHSAKIAPYTLVVGGPPEILNKIVFTEHEGNILVKQHAGSRWKNLSQMQLFNWPNVCVEVKLPDMCFTRMVAHKYERFMGLSGDTMVFPQIKHIHHISKINPKVEVQPYSLPFLRSYVDKLNQLLDRIPVVSKERVEELGFILAEFLKDIEEIDIYNRTMSTNVSVGFHIGKSRYIRNKKMVNEMRQRDAVIRSINFYEIISPHIELEFHNFDDKQDPYTGSEDNSTNFENLVKLFLKCDNKKISKEIADFSAHINGESIVYSCMQCNTQFVGLCAYDDLTAHFKNLHRCVQSLLCCKCGKTFKVRDLADSRWAHQCAA